MELYCLVDARVVFGLSSASRCRPASASFPTGSGPSPARAEPKNLLGCPPFPPTCDRAKVRNFRSGGVPVGCLHLWRSGTSRCSSAALTQKRENGPSIVAGRIIVSPLFQPTGEQDLKGGKGNASPTCRARVSSKVVVCPRTGEPWLSPTAERPPHPSQAFLRRTLPLALIMCPLPEMVLPL